MSLYPRSLDLTPCDFFLREYVKNVVYSTNSRSLKDLYNKKSLNPTDTSFYKLYKNINVIYGFLYNFERTLWN